MATIIEQQAPKYPPGSKTAYHPITFGWLIDQFTLYNNPETRMAGQPGVNGVATARGLAYLYQLTMDGTLLSAEARKVIVSPRKCTTLEEKISLLYIMR
ncbi:hypothetical protein TELCIR_20716 [Teladorsagia circumcincta]|uniref:Beta-lactamase-related domain-containing protein n=1 Tax=Teladorsagia circumcincta TaxID=45464 RepID=A0A2G9TIP9_TELCI|nr:hypothetical protein TELCIR_20716 [Teladorsagia circumcincta]